MMPFLTEIPGVFATMMAVLVWASRGIVGHMALPAINGATTAIIMIRVCQHLKISFRFSGHFSAANQTLAPLVACHALLATLGSEMRATKQYAPCVHRASISQWKGWISAKVAVAFPASMDLSAKTQQSMLCVISARQACTKHWQGRHFAKVLRVERASSLTFLSQSPT